jgi:hypothetical protein
MATRQDALAAAARLRAALDDTAEALARPDVEALLAAEASLTHAFTTIPRLRALSAEERAAARTELLNARAALVRCRRLGAALADFVRLSLDARGQAAGYNPSTEAAAALTGRGFQTKA